jgi:hypothetical protein
MKIITTIIAAAAIATAQAELTPKQFSQLETWAKSWDYSYQTTSIRFGRECFLFQRNEPGSPTDLGFALVPTSSDTVDEAINAFIASVITVTAMEDIAARNQIRAKAR